MTSQKIIHVVSYYPPHLGGMEVVAKDLAEHLSQKGSSVLVLTSSIGRNESPLLEKFSNLEIKRLHSIEVAHLPITLTLFWQLLKQPRGSVVHLHLAQAVWPEITMLAARIKKLKVIVQFHLDVEASGRLGFIFNFYKKYILGFSLRAAQRVLVFSKDQQKLIHHKYGVPNNRIVILPNGVADKFYQIPSKRRQTKILSLLFVGRLAIQKRLDRLIDALPKLNTPVQLLIAGEGELQNQLVAQADQLNLTNVKFLGRKSGDALLDLYRQADVLVMPSEKEGMPLVALEAMAAGLPIIASDVPGIRELLKDVASLVNPPTSYSLAKAIDKVAKDSNLRRKLSARSVLKAQDHRWDGIVDKLIILYQKVSDEII